VAAGVVLAVAAAVVFRPSWSGGAQRPDPAGVTIGSLAGNTSTTDPTTSANGVALDPGGFAKDACVAFPPTAGDRHRTVFLDAGHGGPDPGAIGAVSAGHPVAEKALTLPVVLAAARDLRADGYRVVMSRTVDTGTAAITPADVDGTIYTTQGKHNDLMARIRCADLSGAAALVSVHFDAYDSSRVRGATTLYDTARTFSAANHTLATLLQHDIVTAMAAGGWQVPDRGVASDTTAGGGEQTARGDAYGHVDVLGPQSPGYVDQATTMPGALVEPVFITNHAECAIAASPGGQQAIAGGLTHAVEQFLQP
jgi:N-acetylmuramoyl-L-alanine amidase